tara:strand:+ start:79 stop:207 length:129 start_codon:yes stop_codon:yes gene_type:complete
MRDNCIKKQINRVVLAHFPHAKIRAEMIAIIKIIVTSVEDSK